MVTIPDGFNLGSLISDFGALGAYVVGAYVLIYVADLILKAIRG